MKNWAGLIIVALCVLSGCVPALLEDPDVLYRVSGPTNGLRKIFAPSIAEIHSVCDQAFAFGAEKTTSTPYNGEFSLESTPEKTKLYASLAVTRFTCTYRGFSSIVQKSLPEYGRQFAVFSLDGANLKFNLYSLEMALLDESGKELGRLVPSQENLPTAIFFRFTQISKSDLQALNVAKTARFDLKTPEGTKEIVFDPSKSKYPF